MIDVSNLTVQQLNTQISCAAPSDLDLSLHCYLELIKKSLNAHSVSWLAAYKGQFGRGVQYAEIMDDWKVMDLVFPQSLQDRDPLVDKQIYLDMAAANGAVDPLTKKAISSAGTHRVHSLKTELSLHSSTDHWIEAEYLSNLNVNDRLLAVYSHDSEAESYLLIDRSPDMAAFSQADELALYSLISPYGRIHYWLLLERGLINRCQKPLSMRQQQLIRFALNGQSEDQVSRQTGLSKKTVHTYMMEIYKNFNVNSRSELILLWLAPLN